MNDKQADMKTKQSGGNPVRNEIGSDTNRRFLDRMPAFRLEFDMPERLRTLLGELEQTEGRRSPR